MYETSRKFWKIVVKFKEKGQRLQYTLIMKQAKKWYQKQSVEDEARGSSKQVGVQKLVMENLALTFKK